ncbi:MAG TPA: M20/M25/M40 family metallo-hydrolase [Bacteriovoracaceae bacterium]|nr:M20/M25/M40 family metallo-hydrolase [Bacteriovoracaceae bacterium]
MKNLFTIILLSFSLSGLAAPIRKFISIDKNILKSIGPELSYSTQTLVENGSAAIVELSLPQIEEVSHKIHSKLHRCGGFMAHDSLAEARGIISNKSKTFSFIDYSVSEQAKVVPMLEQVSEEEIRKMVLALSSYETRHYQSETGTQSVQFIHDSWVKLSRHRSDVKVELVKHDQWAQPSVILTISGSAKTDEIIILGGHADSIAMDGDEAPGADDNASGIASVTEVIRLLMVNNYKPNRTIQFMAYAAEEVGLLGSKEIAKSYRKEKKKVVGVMQLDMTLFKGSQDKDIFLISDYTNKAQNTFMGKLIDEYVKVPWGYSKCGYGCSDHASWSSMGYPASFPFETSMEDHNPNIHTIDDTLESAGGNADHAVKFTKLSVAYILEMTK